MRSDDVDLAGRDVRQRDLVPPDGLARCHAVVVGVGSVGRQVALQLAATGVPAMTGHSAISAAGALATASALGACPPQQPPPEVAEVSVTLRFSCAVIR